MVLRGQDRWRQHPLLHNLWKNPMPGLGKAAAIFAVYCCFEFAFKNYEVAPVYREVKFTQEKIGETPDSIRKGHHGGHH